MKNLQDLKNIKISWADNEFGRGPTGLSIRNKEVAVMQNMATNPSYTPWREEALKRGYSSSICLPLIIDNETMSLCIYSSETNAFDEEEVNLLRELANDLSYGISSIRTRLKREEAEKEKYESEEKFAKAFNSSPVTITIADLKTGVLIDANPAFETLTGYSLSEAIGKTGNELNLFPNPEEREKMVEEIRKNQKARDIDFILRDKNGALHNVKVSSDIVKFGNADCILSTIIDVTKDKETQEALARSEHHLNEAQRIAKIGNWDWDAVKNKIWWSKEYYNLYGLDPNQPTPNYEEHLKAYTAETAKRLDAAVKNSTTTGEPYEVELELTHPTATTRWVLARGEAIRDDQGKIIGLRGTSQDITKEKESEQKLRASEEYFHSIIVSMEEGVVFQDKDGKISFANPTAEKILGLKSEELAGQTSSDRARESKIIHEDGSDFPGDEHPAMVTLKTGKPQNNVIMGFHKPDGALTWISINSQPLISSGEDKPHAVLTTFRDITEQKKAEEAIRQAGVYNRNLIETSLDPMLTINSEGNITDVNHAFELATGFNREKLINTPVKQYFTDPEKVMHGLEETINKGFVRDYRVAIKNQSGNVIDCIWNTILYKNEKGNIQGIFAAARDISQLNKTELALQESEEKFKTIFDNSTVGNSVTLLDGTLTVNKAYCDMLGYTQEEFKNKKWQEITYPEDIELSNKNINDLLENKKKATRFTKRYIKKDGSIIWVAIGITLQRDGKGKPLYFITSVLDITDRINAEEKIRVAGDYNRNLIETSLDPLVTIGPDGTITDVNKATETITGYSRNELIKSDFSNYFTDPAKTPMTSPFESL